MISTVYTVWFAAVCARALFELGPLGVYANRFEVLHSPALTAPLATRAANVVVLADTTWITVPDLNLHLGAAHFAELLRRYDGRIDAAVAAYNAGGRPVTRWLQLPGAADPDRFLEGITYPETRGYVRSVLRNRALYQALYPPADTSGSGR